MTAAPYRLMASYLEGMGIINEVAGALAFVSLAAMLFSLLPLRNGKPFSCESPLALKREKLWLWAVFALGFGFWLTPVLANVKTSLAL